MGKRSEEKKPKFSGNEKRVCNKYSVVAQAEWLFYGRLCVCACVWKFFLTPPNFRWNITYFAAGKKLNWIYYCHYSVRNKKHMLFTMSPQFYFISNSIDWLNGCQCKVLCRINYYQCRNLSRSNQTEIIIIICAISTIDENHFDRFTHPKVPGPVDRFHILCVTSGEVGVFCCCLFQRFFFFRFSLGRWSQQICDL